MKGEEEHGVGRGHQGRSDDRGTDEHREARATGRSDHDRGQTDHAAGRAQALFTQPVWSASRSAAQPRIRP